MNVPPPRVREVLCLLRDLSPDQARTLLGQVVATLDAAEVIALRAWLPPTAVHCLPSCVGAVTVMNEAPMPWEFAEPPPLPPPRVGVETAKIILDTLPPASRTRKIALIAAACVLVIGLALSLLLLRSGEESTVKGDPLALVPLPPAREYAPMRTPKIATVKKVITHSAARKPVSPADRDQAAEWSSPFAHRH